ncbi:MAG: hypothetical protein QOH96_4264 [Blastocatellia bacterium]|nr:hypothetical protein [Blastocatellia bacterium]
MDEDFLFVPGPALVLPEGPAKDFDPGLEFGRDIGLDADSDSNFSGFFVNDPSSGLVFGLAVDFNPGLRFGPEEDREGDSDPDFPQDLLSGRPTGLAEVFEPGLVVLEEGREFDSDSDLSDFFTKGRAPGPVFCLDVDFNPGLSFDLEVGREDEFGSDRRQDLSPGLLPLCVEPSDRPATAGDDDRGLLPGLPPGLAADFDPGLVFGLDEGLEVDSDAGLPGDFVEDFSGVRPSGRDEGFEYLRAFGSERGRAAVAEEFFAADVAGDFDALFRSRGFFVISILTSRGDSIRHFPTGSLSSRRNPI